MKHGWWPGPESNRRHKDFQSFALPTELPHLWRTANIIKQMEIDKNTAKNHKYVPILSNLGEADLSSHIDFWALKNAVSLNNVQTYGAISQRSLLMRCGIDIRFKTLIDKNPDMLDILHNQYNRLVGLDQMGELFKAITITSSTKIVPLGFYS